MKKLMFATAAMAAGVAMAGEITSANIVGFTSKDVEQAKFYILSAQFDKVGGGRNINDLVTGLEGVDYGEGFTTTAPQIQALKADGGYNYYFYLNDAWYDDGSEEGAVKPGWADANGNLVDDKTAEFADCAGFWFKNPLKEAKPNVSGEVSNDATTDVSCGTGFQLVANAYPMAITLNGPQMTSDDITGVDYGEGFTSTATQIQALNTTGGYSYYFYLNDAWYDDGSEEGNVKPGWADANGNFVEGVIPAMAGFWTKGTSGAFTLTFKGL